MRVEEQVLQRGNQTCRPLCGHLGISPIYYSKGLEEAVVDFGAEDSFALAAERLARHHRVELSGGTIRKITLKHAQAMRKRQHRGGGVGRLPRQGAEELIAEADGTMLPVVEFESGFAAKGAVVDKRKSRKTAWKEARLCAAKAKDQASATYGCSLEGVEQLGYQWAQSAQQCGWSLESQIQVLSDGAGWIATQAREHFGDATTHLLDFYHVIDYLACAQKARGQWMNPRKRWLCVQKNRLRKSQAHKIITELEPYLEDEHAEQTPIRNAWRYLSNHLDQLDYKTALEKGLPIGSGLIEGGHRHVLQKRLKISGGWWLKENLSAMAALRVLRANQRWNSYWQSAA